MLVSTTQFAKRSSEKCFQTTFCLEGVDGSVGFAHENNGQQRSSEILGVVRGQSLRYGFGSGSRVDTRYAVDGLIPPCNIRFIRVSPPPRTLPSTIS